MKLCYIGFVLLIQLYLTKQEDENEFYHNHFAVEIQDGSRETAEKVAQRHGFTNLGHILENHYLFEHPHIHKRYGVSLEIFLNLVSKGHHPLIDLQSSVKTTMKNFPKTQIYVGLNSRRSSSVPKDILMREMTKLIS